MKISDITVQIVAEHAAKAVKLREERGPGGERLYEVRSALEFDFPTEQDEVEGRELPEWMKDWVILDATTAHALNTVRAALNEANRARWNTLPLLQLVEFSWARIA